MIQQISVASAMFGFPFIRLILSVQTIEMKYLTVVLLFCSLLSCKKKKEEPTKTQLITSSSWKYDNGGIDQDRNGSVDFTFESTGLLQPCILDNTGKFNSDGSGLADEGATKCNTTAPQTTAFTWSFQNNETELKLTGSGLFGL